MNTRDLYVNQMFYVYLHTLNPTIDFAELSNSVGWEVFGIGAQTPKAIVYGHATSRQRRDSGYLLGLVYGRERDRTLSGTSKDQHIMTLKLKSKAGSRTLFVPENVSHEQAIQIVRETAMKNTCDEFDTGYMEERLNLILQMYADERARPTKKQLSATLLSVRLAVRSLVNELPKAGTAAFSAIVAAGDEFARRHGAHSGLSPIHHPGSRSITAPASAGRRMAPAPPPWTDYRTAQRLGDTLAYVKALSEWLHNLPVVLEQPRRTSPIVWLIGGGLPMVFEDTFDKKFGNGRIGPGARFVKAVLSIGGKPSPISEETIKTYRTEWLKAQKGV